MRKSQETSWTRQVRHFYQTSPRLSRQLDVGLELGGEVLSETATSELSASSWYLKPQHQRKSPKDDGDGKEK